MILLLPLLSSAQSRKELEKKRDGLDKQIKTTTALIDQARREQRLTQEQVQLLEAQIGQRNELIATMNGELSKVGEQIRDDEAVIRSLERDMEQLKEGYARMVQFSYRNRNAYDRLSYLFAAESFTQAFRRSRYLNQIAMHRANQARLIQGTQTSLAAKVEALKGQKQQKAALLGAEVNERKKLTVDRSEQQSALAGLRKEEGRLKEQMRKQEKQRTELASRIKRLIEDEVGKTGGTKKDASGKTTFTLTPEAKLLGADFEKNRGKLPWPVEKGVICSGFGKQPHPVLKGIEIENNGIDVCTEKGATVRAIFKGEVSSIIVIPGAGKAVVVNHGAYRTVYSNLREASVNKGQKLETKGNVGTVLTEDGRSIAHIEIWKITSDGLVKVDPAPWLFK
ncbi:MAG: peptidoglycan DD-metalloendopeptidase family protein [Flavobacteriales bacterium]